MDLARAERLSHLILELVRSYVQISALNHDDLVVAEDGLRDLSHLNLCRTHSVCSRLWCFDLGRIVLYLD